MLRAGAPGVRGGLVAVNRKLLGIYLNDHLAGSTVGVEIARRTRGANRGSEFGPELEELAREIEEDREALRDVLARLGLRPDPLKGWLAWAGEKAGRLKLNGQLTGYSPLSRLVEIEVLLLGVAGKQSMWDSLRLLADADPRLDRERLDALAARAESQRRRLAGLRDRAAALALGE
jgi:hypothetical protein